MSFIKRSSILAGLLCFFSLGHTSEGLWSFGLRTHGLYDFQPGVAYVLGPEIGYSNYLMAAHRLQFKAAYLTSRLENFRRESTPKQDYFLFSPVWHFGRNNFFDPTIQTDLGYSRYEIKGSQSGGFDNDTFIADLQIGISLNLFQGEYGLLTHLGYNFIAPKSSQVKPSIFGFGFWIML